jgi:hypothetical protein
MVVLERRQLSWQRGDGPAPPGSPVVVRLPGHGPARSARFGADYPEAERWLLSFAPEPLCIDCIRCEP